MKTKQHYQFDTSVGIMQLFFYFLQAKNLSDFRQHRDHRRSFHNSTMGNDINSSSSPYPGQLDHYPVQPIKSTSFVSGLPASGLANYTSLPYPGYRANTHASRLPRYEVSSHPDGVMPSHSNDLFRGGFSFYNGTSAYP